MSRRHMLKVTGGSVLGASLFGCSSARDVRPLTIVSAMGAVKDKSIASLCEQYVEANPGTAVEFVQLPWDQAHAKILTMIAGGNPPDLMYLTGQWVSELRAMNALEDLTRWHKDWEHKDIFTPVAIQRCESSAAIDSESVFGLPQEVTAKAMFYHKQRLEELGMEPASTRAEWRILLEGMTDVSRDRFGYALRGARGGLWSWWPIVEEFSGTNHWFDGDNQCIINGPDHVAGLTYWNDLYQDGLSPPDSVNWGYTELVQGFWSGLCGAMEQDNEVVATCLEHGMDETTLLTARMPAGPKATVTTADIWILTMAASTPDKDAAWGLYSWLMSPEQLGAYAKGTGTIPSYTAGLDDPALSSGFYKPFVDMVSDPGSLANWYPSYLPEMGEFIEVTVTEEQQKMLLKQQSPQETLDKLATFLNRAQKRYVDQNGPDVPGPPAPA